MIDPNRREREQLLDEVERKLGYVGYAEFWLHIPTPERATDSQLERWRSLATSEKMRVADQYDKQYEALQQQVFADWTRKQRVRNGIRSGSMLLALAAVLVFCLGIYDLLPSTTTSSAAFLPLWWFTALLIMAGLYAAICKIGEYFFDLEERRSSLGHTVAAI